MYFSFTIFLFKMQKIPVSSCVFDGKTQKRAILSIPRENSSMVLTL